MKRRIRSNLTFGWKQSRRDVKEFMRRGAHFLLLFLIPVVMMAGMAVLKPIRPVAMVVPGSDVFLVLDEELGVVRILPNPTWWSGSVLAKFEPSWQPVDLASSSAHIFVTLAMGTYGSLLQYSIDGRWERSFNQPTILTGLAADDASQRLFLSGPSSGYIYVYSWNDPSQNPIKPFVRVPRAASLGPQALDVARSTLFVGDVGSGKIFSIDLSTKRSRELISSSLGQPAALVFDRIERKLYVADRVGRKIWIVQVDAGNPRATVFAAASAFRSPSALAIGPNKTLWVGDPGAKALFQLSSKGTVLATYEPVVSIPVQPQAR